MKKLEKQNQVVFTFSNGIMVLKHNLRVKGVLHEKINKRATLVKLKSFLENSTHNKK